MRAPYEEGARRAVRRRRAPALDPGSTLRATTGILAPMSETRSAWGRPEDGDAEDAKKKGSERAGSEKSALAEAKERATELGERAAEMGGKVAANVRPVADAVSAGVKKGLGKVGDALRVDDAPVVSPELLTQADLPELGEGDPLLSLAKRLDREADFWRGVAMRQLGRAAWTERLGVSSSILLIVGGVVLASIAGFRALFATKGGDSTAMLVGVGLGVLLASAVAVSSIASRLRKGQLESVRDATNRADLAERRIHHIAMLLELRAAGREGYVAALADLESDVRKA